MPIILQDNLPVQEALMKQDDINVIRKFNAEKQDIRAQEYLLLNLMPSAVLKRTERQIARLLGHTALQVRLTLMRTAKDAQSPLDDHLESFYKQWKQIKDQQFDGMIITGAPVEHLQWQDVRFWDELMNISEWAETNVTTRMHICWAAQAALKRKYGIEKVQQPRKLFGIYKHTLVDPDNFLVQGFDDVFNVPVSRHTTISDDAIQSHPNLKLISTSDVTGPYLIADTNGRDIYVTNHPEYGKSSLGYEYERDMERNAQDGKDSAAPFPKDYYPSDNPALTPHNTWRAHARALYSNVLTDTYSKTPYAISDIQNLPASLT